MHAQHMITLALFSVGMLLCANAWSSQAGLVQFVHGDVTVTDVSGTSRAAYKGDAINEGDTLVSARKASAQIKMNDGGFIAVRPNTRLKFDSFKFSKKPNKPESAFFSLLRGGFRAITGLIGRVRHEDYKIKTPVATIGIRGTDHETVVVLPGDPMAQAGQAAPGAYNKVNVGETSITTNKGTINVLPNQMGFAGGPNQMPQIKPINTNLFTVVPPPAPAAKTNGGGDSNNGGGGERATAVVDNTAKEQAGGNAVNNAGNGAAAVVQTIVPPTVVPTQLPQVTQFNGVNPTATNLNFMSAEYDSNYGSHNASNWVTGMTATFDTQGILTALDTLYGGGYSRLNATTYEGGSDQGVIAWGRWAGGTPDLYGWGAVPLTVDQGFHMIVGQPVTSPPLMDGVAYSFIGGTRPTEASNTPSGNVWSVSGGGLTANFLSNTLSANLNLGMNSAGGSSAYVMNVTGSASATGFNSVSGGVTFQNGALNVCGASCNANGTVMFVGPTATHAGMIYQFGQSNSTYVQGAAVFKQ